MISVVMAILIKILGIIKNSPITSRDRVTNWVKIKNNGKLPNEIAESAENDGEILKYAKNSQWQINPNNNCQVEKMLI